MEKGQKEKVVFAEAAVDKCKTSVKQAKTEGHKSPFIANTESRWQSAAF